MKRASRIVVILSLLMFGAAPVLACLWDTDTLNMERRRFPDALELINGKFLRHSTAFYEWRVKDRERRIADDDSFELLDDLAVAYEKTGNHAKAIEIAEGMLERDPNRYETLANLGTFYVHDGQLQRGLEFIERAIEINPSAHFGRERYQKYLVEYVLSKTAPDAQRPTLPLRDALEKEGHDAGLHPTEFTGLVGFAEFVVLQQLGEEPEEKRATTDEERRQRTARRDARHDAERRELEAATKGVLGMMRFGNFESPVLLEALGDLLLSGDTRNDSKRLAGRAYLKASYGVKDARTKRRFREMADQTISGHMQMEVAQLERTFKRELAEAANWYKRVEADELAWIEQGVDVDAAFAEKYYSAPTVGGPVAAVMTSQRASIVMWVLTLGVVAVVAVAAIAGLGLAIIIFRRKPSLPAKPA